MLRGTLLLDRMRFYRRWIYSVSKETLLTDIRIEK
jgi:hypothetical protein